MKNEKLGATGFASLLLYLLGTLLAKKKKKIEFGVSGWGRPCPLF